MSGSVYESREGLSVRIEQQLERAMGTMDERQRTAAILRVEREVRRLCDEAFRDGWPLDVLTVRVRDVTREIEKENCE